MFLKHLLEDLAKLPVSPYAETNIESIDFACGGIDVYLEAGSKDEDITKLNELEDEIAKLKGELAEYKEKLESDEGITAYKEELKSEQENVIRVNNEKMKKWEEFARKCYESLTPKWKGKMQYAVINMNKFIAECNKNEEKKEDFA